MEATANLQQKKDKDSLQRIERKKQRYIRETKDVTTVAMLIARYHRRKVQTEQIISRQHRLRHRTNNERQDRSLVEIKIKQQ